MVVKLYYSATSPYARKVRVAVAERRLDAMVELVPANPLAENGVGAFPNPLGKIPALLLEDGTNLFDSPVICAFLDTIGNEPPLVPAGAARWRCERAQALGDGILDAAFNLVMEGRRAQREQSEYWINRWSMAILRSVSEVSADVSPPSLPFDLGHVTYACALGYLDFRLPHLDWRGREPALLDWYNEVSHRPSFVQSAPA